MISQKLQEAINVQIAAEMWSSNLYLSMSFYFKKLGYDGFASWMRKQSQEELEHAYNLADYVSKRGKVKEAGYVVGNVDATIIAQKPKMRPYIESMRENVAKALCVDVSRINIKATTEEGLGFTGSGQGISAQAICLLEEEPVLI